MTKGWKCNNCGHVHEATENLKELGFTWYDNGASKTSCQNCGSYTLQKAYTWDEWGRPIAGHFLIVKSHIRKGKK
jgi:DNA-directed RNA polymerase subunit RPC12/RpoP